VERTQSSGGDLVVTVSDFEQIKEKYKGDAEFNGRGFNSSH
jgi:hypothetical protein